MGAAAAALDTGVPTRVRPDCGYQGVGRPHAKPPARGARERMRDAPKKKDDEDGSWEVAEGGKRKEGGEGGRHARTIHGSVPRCRLHHGHSIRSAPAQPAREGAGRQPRAPPREVERQGRDHEAELVLVAGTGAGEDAAAGGRRHLAPAEGGGPVAAALLSVVVVALLLHRSLPVRAASPSRVAGPVTSGAAASRFVGPVIA